MATVFRLRYIYAGSRLIFVEQPDSDKYRIVHSDLVLGQSLVGFISPGCQFSGSSTGITFGSATETQTFSNPLFAEMQGRILIPHTAIGYAHISRFVSVSGGLALDHAAGPLNTESKLAEAQNKLTTPSTAELINTRTKLTGAKEKILAEQKNKTFETSDPKFNGSSTGAAFGHGAAGIKVDDSVFDGSASGTRFKHTADATVDLPPAPTIRAGRYTGKHNLDITDPSEMPLFRFNIAVSYVQNFLTFTATSLESDGSGVITAWEEYPWYGSGIAEVFYEDEWYVGMMTDDYEFTVVSDTTVTAEEYAAFMAWFEPVTP